MIEIKSCLGSTLKPYIETISEMRASAFKHFPYLYNSTEKEEREYMEIYHQDPKASVHLAFSKEEIIGISTGIPLASDSGIANACQHMLIKNNEKIEDYYYYGEIIVKERHRGQSVAKKLYEACNETAKKLGYYKVCFLTIKRQSNHPLQPANYQSPERIWQHLGFKRLDPSDSVYFEWSTYQADGAAVLQKNTLDFWVKTL